MEKPFRLSSPSKEETKIEVLLSEIYMFLLSMQRELGFCVSFVHYGHVNNIDVTVAESQPSYQDKIYSKLNVYIKKDDFTTNEKIIEDLTKIQGELFELKKQRIADGEKIIP